jgi:cysteine desulfuration protein SufE
VLTFAGQSDSHIVQGLIAILLALVDNKPASDIEAMDIAARFAKLGLKEHLTPQRSNGLASMVDRIKADARAALAATSAGQ